MDAGRGKRLARALVWAIAAIAAAALGMTLLAKGSTSGPLALVGVALALLGALVVRRAGNPIGWFFLVAGASIGLAAFTDAFINYSFLGRSTPLWGTSAAGWVNSVAFTTLSAPLPLIFLLFPSGRVPSGRWRPVVWLWTTSLVLLVAGVAFRPGNVFESTPQQGGIHIANPLGVHGAEPVLGPLIQAAVVGLVAVAALSTVSLFMRFRLAKGEERQQLKWLAYVAGLLVLLFAVLALGDAFTHDNPTGGLGVAESFVWGGFAFLFAIGIPGAVVIAVLRYRLYDIDVVINKTLVYGSLAAFITAVYVGIVVGIGAAIGQGSSKPNLGLSILATAVVAVAFQPVRERIQRFANRLVYGKRATPYEVLSEFGHRMAGTYAADDVLRRMARILAEGTGAKEARVWVRVGSELRPGASWPEQATPPTVTSPNGDTAPLSGDGEVTYPVIHQGEDLGALSIAKAPGERLTPAEDKLTNDLASQAGLVLRNVKLIEDLKASRVRLVQAQDEERRKIERNIHDGAQQQLVALNVKLGLARRLATEPAKLDPILTQLQDETNQALQDLRDLARGIYPPLLQDQGLLAALHAQARKVPIPVILESDSIARYPQDIEAAVYFCALEALQNVAKYAKASAATVTLSGSDGRLAFAVTDDGAGFDTSTTSYGTGLQGMADRLAALGGEMEVRSQRGHGTTVTGRVPVRTLEPVA